MVAEFSPLSFIGLVQCLNTKVNYRSRRQEMVCVVCLCTDRPATTGWILKLDTLLADLFLYSEKGYLLFFVLNPPPVIYFQQLWHSLKFQSCLLERARFLVQKNPSCWELTSSSVVHSAEQASFFFFFSFLLSFTQSCDILLLTCTVLGCLLMQMWMSLFTPTAIK